MAFGVAGYYYAEIFKVGDICEQVNFSFNFLEIFNFLFLFKNINIVNKQYPDRGRGIFKYIDCFLPVGIKTNFKNLKYFYNFLEQCQINLSRRLLYI